MSKLMALGVAVLMSGCAMTESVRSTLPATSLPESFSVDPDMLATTPTTASSPWWEEFNEPVLSALVVDALARNTDVEAAITRLQQARASASVGLSASAPRGDVSAGASRSSTSLEDPARDPNAARASTRWAGTATVTWEADLFGRRDAENRALAWRVQAAKLRANALLQTVASDVVIRALDVAALDEQLRLSAQNLVLANDLIDVAKAKARGGQASQQDVSRAQVQSARTQVAAAQLRSNRANALASLAILLATTPDEIAHRVSGIKLPDGVSQLAPLVAPSEMLRNRPDVQAAAAELNAASGDLAAIAAQRFPRFNIAASLGMAAASVAGLGSANAITAALLPSISWRALDFGELDARVAGAKASEGLGVAQYKSTVFRAFAEAQTALINLQNSRYGFIAAKDAWREQQSVCEVQRSQFSAGLAEIKPVLEACKEFNDAADTLVQAQRQVLADRVQLHKSLGTGYRTAS